MELIVLALSLTTIIPTFLAVFFYFKLKKITSQPKKYTVEAQELLADIMSGKMGMFAVARVNQEDLMIRSPRRE